ncbi:MAG: hypothetical protein AAGF12_21115 [Myxococcota bacterium]
MADAPLKNAIAAYLERGGSDEEHYLAHLRTLVDGAPSLVPLVTVHPELLQQALQRPLELGEDATVQRDRFLAATQPLDPGPDLEKVLRKLRHAEILRVTLRELLGLADIDQTSAEVAALAASAVETALAAALRVLDPRPASSDGTPVPLVCLGMGKLGGFELNIGSDIDLCFFHGDPTDGAPETHELSEIYSRVVSSVSRTIGAVTEDGFVFRVDLRLRPEGTRGPLISSHRSALRYYREWGAPWERAALLRASPIAGDRAFGDALLADLQSFIYPRRVDPGIAEEMQALVRRARREHRADDQDIKLGRGGIREAEFFVQSLQLIWGGIHPELRVPGTIEAARRLHHAGYLRAQELTDLERAWALLRRVEHRIHVQTGYQTHRLPDKPEAVEALARSLGYDREEFGEALGDARRTVIRLFDSLVSTPSQENTILLPLVSLADRLQGGTGTGADKEDLRALIAEALPIGDPDAALSHLSRLGRRARSPFGPVTAREYPKLGATILAEVAQAADADIAIEFLAHFFGRLGGNWSYGRLFRDDPVLLSRLIGLFGSSATLSWILVRHPENFDQLLRPEEPLDVPLIEAQHRPLLEASWELPELVGALRRLKGELTLAIGLRLVGTEIDLDRAQELLSALAEQQIRVALAQASRSVAERQGNDGEEFAVLGHGKLGGGELGFGSDLDVVFIHDGGGADALSRSTRVAQLTMSILSQPDPAGTGYHTDTRLRPGGTQGLLVVSAPSFLQYHRTRQQPWERQALLRARPIAGSTSLLTQLTEDLVELAYLGGPVGSEGVAQMRGRMERELAGEKQGRYHPKLGFGGLVDVEFAAQLLQMNHGADPAIRTAHTVSALRVLREQDYLHDETGERLEDAYGFLRSIEQALKLLDEAREPIVQEGSRSFTYLVRRLGFRERGGESGEAVLLRTYREVAERTRRIFEELIGPVGTVAPWRRRP